MKTEGWNDIFDYSSGHNAKWFRCGPEFFDLVNQVIRNAHSSIHIQIYIIDPDTTGTKLLTELMNAAQRGVDVYLVVDDFGADKLGKEEEIKLTESGVKFKRFEPYLSSSRFYVGRRMHHKVIIVDEKTAIVGGMNVADRYHGTPESPPWLDYAVMVDGPVIKKLVATCQKILEREFTPSIPKIPSVFTKSGWLDLKEVWVRPRKNDWLRNRREISRSYNKAVRLSHKSITIVGGYFLPGRRFLQLLGNASKRGVEVKIILTRFSDVPIVKRASEYLYGKLFKYNVRIYEAKEVMVHGKVAVVDEIWSTIGSYNQNHLSAYLSIELNLDIVNREFSTGLNNHLLEVIRKECVEMTDETFVRRSNLLSKVKRWISYQLVRLSLRMLFTINRIFKVND